MHNFLRNKKTIIGMIHVAAGLDFVRAEGFVFGHVAGEGYIECAYHRLTG